MTTTESQVPCTKSGRQLFVFMVVCLSVLVTDRVFAFKIVTPAADSTVQSGQTIKAEVDLGRDSGIVKVRYYWYPESADTLVQQDDSDASVRPQQDRLTDERVSQRDSISGMPVVAVAALSSGSDRCLHSAERYESPKKPWAA